MSIKLKQLSSLAKVYQDKIYGSVKKQIRVAKGQTLSYQIAYKGEGEYSYKIKSPIKKYIEVYQLGFVPTNLPTYEKCDDGLYQRLDKSILYPDTLTPKSKNKIKAEKTYNAIWLNIKLPKDIEAGKYPISVIFSSGEECTFTVNVENVVFNEKEIIFTQWFHTDCIANVHKAEVYSEKHWALIEKYIKMATEHGINMLLIPALTPPLDTAVGGERTTVQLVDITYENGEYSFDFSKFTRFIEIARKCGVKYYEINHMFTQWGAKHAPKVIATVNGEKKRIFGWETDATSQEYKEFLSQLIPAIIKELTSMGIDKEHIVFHASDEPNMDCIENYRKASEILEPLIDGCVQMDAISDLEFYKQGIIKRPVCGIDAIHKFIEAGVANMWGYYCCAQTWEVSNRFLSMSSERNRIIGTQIYKYALEGFLHWGYNFYYTQYSKKKINPYKITDAGGAFPSGDAFSVYPYRNGVIPSLRLKVFKEALDDVSLLYMLENKIGREKTIELLEGVAEQEITFKSYPREEKFFEKLTNKIFQQLKK
ncbi:MAG: DUF4091 domain-containing protein [Clostridia bacterium]|nr:DUF4091 domain-containing protein [Clostridia bacterium]